MIKDPNITDEEISTAFNHLEKKKEREELKRKMEKWDKEEKQGNFIYQPTQNGITISIRNFAYPLAASLFFIIAISSLLFYQSIYNTSNLSKRGSIATISK